MVPYPLPPSVVKANSVLLCFFLPQVNSSKLLKIQALSPKQKRRATLQVIHQADKLATSPGVEVNFAFSSRDCKPMLM